MNENKFLTEEEFQKLRDRGYSENDIVDLKAALNLVEISEMIPEDVNALLEKIEKKGINIVIYTFLLYN